MDHVTPEPPEKRRQLMSLQALADKLGVNRQRVYELARIGKIKVIDMDNGRGRSIKAVEPKEVKRLMALSAPMLSGGGRKIVRFSAKLDETFVSDDEI